MTWRVYADPLTETDLTTATGKSIRFTPSEKNLVITGCFTFLVFNNPGSFSDLVIKLYSDRETLPGSLIATATRVWDKSDLLTTHNNGIKYVGFSFGQNISLNLNTYYHLVLNCSGYTFGESSHIAWEKAWPDPIYNQPASWNDLDNAQYKFGLIGARL